MVVVGDTKLGKRLVLAPKPLSSCWASPQNNGECRGLQLYSEAQQSATRGSREQPRLLLWCGLLWIVGAGRRGKLCLRATWRGLWRCTVVPTVTVPQPSGGDLAVQYGTWGVYTMGRRSCAFYIAVVEMC